MMLEAHYRGIPSNSESDVYEMSFFICFKV